MAARPFTRSGLHRLECEACEAYIYARVAQLEAHGLPSCACSGRLVPERLELALLLGVDHPGIEVHARLTVNKTYSQDRSLAKQGRSKVELKRARGEINDMAAEAASELEQSRAARARARRMAALGLREVWSKPERGRKAERSVFKIDPEPIPF